MNDAHENAVDVSASAGLIETVEALWNNLQGLVHDQLQLAILETLRVGKSLVAIFTCTLVIALLIASSWLCLVGALVLWFIQYGMNASIALLLALLMNLVGVVGLLFTISHYSQRLRFPATMNTLKRAAPLTNSQTVPTRSSATGQS